MRIAVASEGLEVSPYFGQCASFMCYTVKHGVIVECQNMPNPRIPINELIELLHELDVRTIIVGRIEYDIANLMCHSEIEVVAGAKGSAREVAQAYLTRTLTGVDELCHIDLDTDAPEDHNLAGAL